MSSFWQPLTYTWAPAYRYERIGGMLSRMTGPSVEAFRRMQMDTHSVQADRLLPKLNAFMLSGPRAAQATAALRILAEWDRSFVSA